MHKQTQKGAATAGARRLCAGGCWAWEDVCFSEPPPSLPHRLRSLL